MKKLTPSVLKAIMLFSVIPSAMEAGDKQNLIPIAEPKTPEAIEADALTARLYEIKSLDLKKMNSIERKQLRTEVHAIKGKMKGLSGGIYLSATAIIIILLVLLLL